MTQEQFQQASGLFQAGDKLGAERILFEITRLEPGNADAWFALAVCAGSVEARKARLEKCLAISPDHPKALNSLSKFQEAQQARPSAGTQLTPSATNEIKEELIMDEELEKQTKPARTRNSTNWIYPIFFLILAGLIVWQFIRIDRLEKSVIQLASGLDYVTPLAENANRYAHSHYSDLRLKTGVQELSNSLEKVMQLRGVSYQWNVADYPQMNFSDKPQIGVIAQEVEGVFPELVTTDANGYKQVDYEKLSAVLIEAIKEQQKEISTLVNQINH